LLQTHNLFNRINLNKRETSSTRFFQKSQPIEFYNTHRTENNQSVPIKKKRTKRNTALLNRKKSSKPKRKLLRALQNNLQEEEYSGKHLDLENLVVLSKPQAIKSYYQFAQKQQSSKNKKNNFFSSLHGNRSLSQMKGGNLINIDVRNNKEYIPQEVQNIIYKKADN